MRAGKKNKQFGSFSIPIAVVLCLEKGYYSFYKTEKEQAPRLKSYCFPAFTFPGGEEASGSLIVPPDNYVT